MASIYILFPKEHPALVQPALQHFRWAVERFEAMAARNPLAKAALGVLRAIYLRLKRSLGIVSGRAGAKRALPGGTPLPGNNTSLLALWDATTPSLSTTPALSASRTPTTTTSPDTVSPLQGNQHLPTPPTGFSSLPSTSPEQDQEPEPFTFALDPDLFPPANNAAVPGVMDWNPPSDFDWASLQPIYATSDLVYHDLVGIRGAGGVGQVDYGGFGNVGGVEGVADVEMEGMWAGLGGQGVGEGLQQEQQQQEQQQQQQHGVGYQEGMGMGVGIAGDAVCVQEAGVGGMPGVCRFGGQFGDDSVWSLLNQYTPY